MPLLRSTLEQNLLKGAYSLFNIVSAVKGMEVTRDSASLAELRAQASTTICVRFSTRQHCFHLLRCNQPLALSSYQVGSATHFSTQAHCLLKDKPREARGMPEVVVSAAAVWH